MLRPFTVCVVDDCVDEVTLLSEGLRLHGYEVIAAFTGEEALALCDKGEVDLLLLDIGLPDLDGHEVCRRLKQGEATRDIPVIFVTARGAAEHVMEGYDLGAVDYIAKPYNLPMVMVRVDSVMRTRQVEDYLRGHHDLLHDPVYTDQLTGLRNRRFLMERLHEEAEKAHRYNYPVSCILLDVDEMHAIDNEAGVPALDEVVAEVAMLLRGASRAYDILARIDGAQFAAVLPHAKLQDAIAYAQKIHQEAESTPFSLPANPTRAELSFGIVSCRNGSTRGPEALVGEAMKRLLQAKSLRDGKIRIAGRDLSASEP